MLYVINNNNDLFTKELITKQLIKKKWILGEATLFSSVLDMLSSGSTFILGINLIKYISIQNLTDENLKVIFKHINTLLVQFDIDENNNSLLSCNNVLLAITLCCEFLKEIGESKHLLINFRIR